MRKKILKILSIISIICLIFCTIFSIACATKLQPEFEKSGITVTLMNGEHYHVNGANKVKANDGEVVFTVTVDKGYIVTGSFGDKCEITTKSRSLNEVKFKDIEYSCVVQLETEKPNQVYSIYYYLGDSDPIYQDCTALLAHHPKANTLTERYLREQGYITDETDKMLVGWETEDGKYIGLGSRAEVSGEDSVFLSAVWKDYSDTALFTAQDGKIIDYTGNEEEVVIPRRINGNDITTISANAFENCKAKVFYIPSSVTTIEDEAFKNCESMTDFYMSDNIAEISDMSFCGCKNFTTLHVNAILDPVYINRTEYAKKVDILNKMELCKNKKIVITGGSNVSYGYSGEAMNNELPNDYTAFNFGFSALLDAVMTYDLLSDFLGEGDIYIHAPELTLSAVYSNYAPSCLTGLDGLKVDFMETLYYVFETDWRLASSITINNYSNFFDEYEEFTKGKINAISLGQNANYEYYQTWVDDWGSICEQATENGYENYYYGSNGIWNFDDITNNMFYGACEKIYSPLIKKGIRVFFTFPILNKANLLRTYYDDEELNKACENYTARIKAIMSNYSVIVLLTQSDNVYLSQNFSGSDYHLGYNNRQLQAIKIIQALKPYLEEQI